MSKFKLLVWLEYMNTVIEKKVKLWLTAGQRKYLHNIYVGVSVYILLFFYKNKMKRE